MLLDYAERVERLHRGKASSKLAADAANKEKTEEAKRLLRYSDKSLTVIGSYLGFSSPSHFSRVFKKYAGCGPFSFCFICAASTSWAASG